MKKWQIDYAIRFFGGEVKEKSATIEAHTIAEAMTYAWMEITNPIRRFPDVTDVTIYSAHLIEGEMF